MKKHPEPIEVLDTIFSEAARVDAEHGITTREDRRWAKTVAASFRQKLAERRRSLLPAKAPRRAAKPLDETLRALPRTALLERLLGHYARMGGVLQVTHRNVRAQTDEDLRQLIQLIESTQTEE